MKYLLSTLLLLISISNITLAQGGNRQGPPPVPDEAQIDNMITQLSEELSLSDVQEKQIAQLYYNHFADVSDMMESDRASDPAMRQEMEKQKASFEKEVKSLLSSKQKKQFESIQSKNTPQNNSQQRPPR